MMDFQVNYDDLMDPSNKMVAPYDAFIKHCLTNMKLSKEDNIEFL